MKILHQISLRLVSSFEPQCGTSKLHVTQSVEKGFYQALPLKTFNGRYLSYRDTKH